MKPGLAKVIDKLHISWYFGSPEIDLHIAENACCVDPTVTWWSKRVGWLSTSQSSHRGTSDYGGENTVELNTGVAWARLPITGIHTPVAPKSKQHWLPAPFHNSRWVDHCEVCHGCIEAILILNPADVQEAYSHIASCYHSVQCHVRTPGQRDVSLGQKEHYVEGRLVLHCEVRSTEAVEILFRSDSEVGQASHFSRNSWTFSEVAIV